jgi:hypothetical protein
LKKEGTTRESLSRALYAYLLPLSWSFFFFTSEGERSACKESEEIAQIMAIVGFSVVVLLVFREANFLPKSVFTQKNKPINSFSRVAKSFFFFFSSSLSLKKCVRVI